MPPTVYYGSLINPVSLDCYEALPRCAIGVGENGLIDWIVRDVDSSLLQEIMAQNGYIEADVIDLKNGQFLMPGLVDTHIHAPQIPNAGSGQQYELLEWLQNVTFPMEAKFADPDFADRTYRAVVRRVIDSGTTTSCYYSSLHSEGSKVLANVIHELGQRAFVGKCNMNRNAADYYVEPSTECSIKDTNAVIAHIKALNSNSSLPEPLVQPILTPRFAISCSDELLGRLGKLAASDPKLRIQTHISENPSEISFTKKLFPKCSSYAHVYDHFGLLRNNTILAHAVHLEDKEKHLVRERRAGISHCPTSNFNLTSGVAPIGEYLDLGIKVGLGTDVSGGFSPSILQAIQTASIAAKVKAMQSNGALPPGTKYTNRQLSIATLLYLATLGGAEVCCLENLVGSFDIGKSFDALLVDIRTPTGNPALWAEDAVSGLDAQPLESKLERFMFCGDDRNIGRVYVQGRCIGGSQR